MAYDEGLVQRIREILEDRLGYEEKKMFGGIGFMLFGNMACGVYKDAMIVRVGPDKYEETLNEPGAREFNITGRPMRGWIFVDKKYCESEENLLYWMNRGIEFSSSLPHKQEG